MKLFFLVIIILSSCANYNIKKFSFYTNTIIDKVDPYPTKEELKEKIGVVVVIDDNTNVNVINFNQKQIASSNLQELLDNLKSVNVLDRGILKSIKEEVIFSEIKSGKSRQENKDADLVFLVKMNSLIFSSQYDARTGAKIGYEASKIALMVGAMVASQGRGIFIDAGGNPVSGEYNYIANFSGEISVIELPSGNVISKIPIQSSIESTESAYDRIAGRPKEVDPKLMEEAITKAISDAMPKISKVVPAVGHIIQRSDYLPNEATLFKATFGSSDGIKIGDKVILQRKKYEINPLNDEKNMLINSIFIGNIIANEFGENFCWIKVTDKALASTIKVAEKVMVYTKPSKKDDE